MGTSTYELRCRECGKTWGNQPRSICEESSRRSKSPTITIPFVRAFRAKCLPRARPTCGVIVSRCRCQRGISPPSQLDLPAGQCATFGEKIGSRRLLVKNDAVWLPTLNFKDRVVAVALANARSLGFDTVACSSTGNLANSVAAQAAREGFKAWIFIPSDLEPAKILGTQVFGAELVRINLVVTITSIACARADCRRTSLGIRERQLAPLLCRRFENRRALEIAEQLGWTASDNVVVPMAGGSLITKIKKAFRRADSSRAGRVRSR